MAGFSIPIVSSLSSGAPNSAGTANIYQTGTTILVTIYSDGDLSNPISNPITLDANGQAAFYVDSTYDLRIDTYTATGGFLKSIDPVLVTNSLAGLTATAAELNVLHSVTPGTASASKALVLDSNKNATGLATNSFNVSSTQIANMAAVQGSQTGGFINRFRNASMGATSRGTSGTITAGSPAYTLDGWIVSSTGANVTWIQQTGLATGSGSYFSDTGITITGAASVSDTLIKQRIESTFAQSLAGQTCTWQGWLYNNTGASITPTLTVKHPTATDNYTGTVTDVSAVSLSPCPNATYTHLAYTFSASASSGLGMEVTIDFGGALSSNLKTAIFFQPEIRSTPGVTLGINSTPPTPEIRPHTVEIPFNQRYLAAFGDIVGVIGHGAATSTSASGYIIPFKAPLRIAPTALSVTTVGDFEIATYAAADVAATTGLTFNASGSSNLHAFVTATVTGTPLTSATAYYLYTKTALAGNLLFTGAEL